ncbi:MAG: DJ-1/PfpI family protein [Actinomycetota bacterium]|jgi:protease I|nr:DJ-1/PfpI family protein [Actinomycetota bacterium]
MARVLMVIAPDQFRDEEYAEPRDVLLSCGAEVVTASIAPGPCRGKLGMIARADVAIGEVQAADYDAVVFIGGGGSSIYFDDPAAQTLASDSLHEGHTTAAICIAPSILAHAGLLKGRRVTAFASQESDLIAHGATCTGSPLEIDGAIITANGPEAAHGFGVAIADAIGLN